MTRKSTVSNVPSISTKTKVQKYCTSFIFVYLKLMAGKRTWYTNLSHSVQNLPKFKARLGTLHPLPSLPWLSSRKYCLRQSCHAIAETVYSAHNMCSVRSTGQKFEKPSPLSIRLLLSLLSIIANSSCRSTLFSSHESFFTLRPL